MSNQGSSVSTLPDSTLLLESAVSILPDIRVQIIYQVYVCHAVFALMCMLLGALPYYHYFGLIQSKDAMIVFVIGLVVLHWAWGFALHKKAYKTCIALGIAWGFCFIGYIGFMSALLVHIALVQFMAISFAQAISIIAYTRISVRSISLRYCIVWMTVASLITWGLSVYGFIVEADWAGGIVIGVLSIFSIGYNTWFIHSTQDKYDASFHQGLTAVCDYYGCSLIYDQK